MAKQIFIFFCLFGLASCNNKQLSLENNDQITVHQELTEDNLEEEVEIINADSYIKENYTVSSFKILLSSLYEDKVRKADIELYDAEVQNLLEFFPDHTKKSFFFIEKNLKILFEIENSFSIIASSLRYCREFKQDFTYYDLSFSHAGLACRDERGRWHLLKRKI